ncbi:MAG: hypothetical protein KA159_02745 [Halioglobus sp.]|nr:hypothetical protein [Halioglobus sp.]MBP6723358.1 hypothetical protein [Halioglobus sp.]
MKKGKWRNLRTLMISVFCLAALLWLAVRQFGVRPEELLELFITAGLVALLVIALAGIAALLWVGLRKLLRDWRGN